MNEPGHNLRQLLRRPLPVDAQPQSAFDHLIKQRVDDLAAQVEDLQKQLWASLGALVIAVIINIFK